MTTNWRALKFGCLILTGVMLGGNPAFVRGQESAGASTTAAVISSVAITQEPQRAAIRVEGAGKLDVHPVRLQNPERLVLDFNGAKLSVQKTSIPGVSAPVRGVRMAQFRPDIARVVIDLTASAPYEIAHDGSAVVVYLKTQGDAGAPTAAASTAPAAPKKEVSASTAAPQTQAAPVTATPSAHFALPHQLTETSANLAAANPPAPPAQPASSSAQQAAQQAVQQATTAATTVAAQQATSASPSPSAGKYSGEPISVNLKDVDLKDFFRLIHEISGLNVVLDPNVKGTLTIVLDEVPWDQALDIVLINNGLDKQLNGNVLRIATRETLKKEAEGARDLQKAQAEAVAPVTVTRVLSYAKASTVRDTLKKFLSPRGDIFSDDRSNQLIIRDIPSNIPILDNLRAQLDRKSQQVEIEARVVQASRSFSQDIGVQWGFAGSTTNGRTVFGGAPQVGISPTSTGSGLPQPPLIGTPVASSSSSGATGGLPFNVNLPAGAPTSGFYFGNRSSNFAVDMYITAAEAKGVGKLLSKPKIITQNNEKATVKQGEKIPIQTTINNTISVQYIDAVLQLEVTPQITAEGTVFMDVLVENTQIDNGVPRVQGIPALSTQSTQTKVLVADGGTVVIGGIIVTQQQTSVTEVPVLGNLPVIGRLFREQAVTISSSELLFFLTPRILPG
jgi:type IV pilus assembly protein PilQ